MKITEEMIEFYRLKMDEIRGMKDEEEVRHSFERI